MNEFDDLDVLERELGPSLRLALRHVAAEITDDRPTSLLGLNGDGAVAAFVEVPSVTDAPETDHGVNETVLEVAGGRRRLWRRHLVAGGLVAAGLAAAGLVAVVAVVGRNSGEIQSTVAPPVGNGLIAFAGGVGDDSPRSDVYVVGPDGTGLRALTSTPDLVEYAPSWSPDGSRLAFVRTAVPPSFTPCTTTDCELVVVDPSTGVETFSAEIPQPDGAVGGAWVPLSLAWSPDGRSIVIQSVACGEGGCGSSVYNSAGSTPAEACDRRGCGGQNSVIADLDTGAFTTFTPQYHALWSPDGEWLSLAQAPLLPGPSLLLAPADAIGTGNVELAELPRVRTMPDGPNAGGVDVAWLPDSSALLFSNGAKIDILTVPDGERRTLIEDGSDPVVSPDGGQIAYRRAGASDDITEIWVVAADGSDPRRAAVSSTPPVWSPDGSVLLAGDDVGWFTVRPDGTARTEIAPLLPPGQLNICCPDNRPSWQPVRMPVETESATSSTAGARAASSGVLDDFESGTLHGWQDADSGAGDWYIYRDGNTAPDPANSDRLDPFSVPDPPQGEFAVVTDMNNPGTRILYRDVTLDGPLMVKLTVFYEVGHRDDGSLASFNTPDTLRFDGEPNLQFRIDLLDPTAAIDSVADGDVLVNVFRTEASDPPSLEPTEVSVDVSELAGRTVRLRLAEAGNQAPVRAGVDNIRFEPLAPGAGVELPDSTDATTGEALQLWDPDVLEAARLGVGFIGVPPVGTRPTTPERGSLVLDIAPCTSEGDPRIDGLSVFADGRVFWKVSGQLLEQRLTPEGVELMRSELLGSGLLGTHDDDDKCVAGAFHGHLVDGGEQHADGFTARADEHIARLINPASWLPASAWADREIKTFVPAEYSILAPGTQRPRTELAARLPALEELIRTKHWECQTGGCYTAFTIDEASALAAALDAAGFDESVDANHRLAYTASSAPTSVLLRPRLPHEVGDGPIPG